MSKAVAFARHKTFYSDELTPSGLYSSLTRWRIVIRNETRSTNNRDDTKLDYSLTGWAKIKATICSIYFYPKVVSLQKCYECFRIFKHVGYNP